MANLFGYLLLVIFCAIIASSNGEDQFKARKLPGGKGWTLNSAAYNGGKEAIQQLYGKRSDHELGDFNIAPAAEDAKRTQFIQDFLQFLKLQESGIFDQKMLRYLLSRSNDQITQP